MLTVKAAAKVNLTLDVLARRSDGYHELASVVHTIGLWDALTFEFGGQSGLRLLCSDDALATEDNLCCRAARAWMAATQRNDEGIQLTLEKRIPTGAGLGGGSSDAAATLVALNRHYGGLLDAAGMHRIAASLGADVPLFLRGGCALIEGIGDRITPVSALAGWIVLLKPLCGLSTPTVYRAWDALKRPSRHATPAMCEAVRSGSIAQVAKALQNDLFHAAQHLHLVDIEALCERLRRAGALGATMTGSGSAVFGLFRDSDAAQAAARELATDNARTQTDCQVWAVPLVAAGMEFQATDMVSVQ